MIVEHFRHGDASPVYARFRIHGRLAPEGLSYIESWVTEDLRRCYQIMECSEPDLLAQWMKAWEDLVEFEVHRVITSSEAAERVM
jgi:hypothetical protein